MESHLCQCGREGQPIIIKDGEVIDSSPSLYQTPPVALPDENQEPLPVRIKATRGGQLVPVIEQDKIDKLFRAIDQERETECDSQEELSVRSPNRQRRKVRVRCHTQVLHAMSTAVNIQPRIPLRQLDGVKGAVRHDQPL